MRRRSKNLFEGADADSRLMDFDPQAWPGANDWERYEAWHTARNEWAEQHLPGGVTDLPLYVGWIPDEPWTPYAPDGTPNF